MPFIPNLFITPHALDQFQQRIAPMEKAKAHRLILAGIRQAANMRLLPDGTSLRIRTRRPFPFEFRAFCVFDPNHGHFVVTTIVRGDSNVTRKYRRKQTKHAKLCDEKEQPAERARDDSTGWSSLPANATRCTGGTSDEPA